MTQQIVTITKTDFEKLVNRLEKLEKQVKTLTANIPMRKELIERIAHYSNKRFEYLKIQI